MARRMITSSGGQLFSLCLMLLIFGGVMVLGTWMFWSDGQLVPAVVVPAVLLPFLGLLAWSIVTIALENRPDEQHLDRVRPTGPSPTPVSPGSDPWSWRALAEGLAAEFAAPPTPSRRTTTPSSSRSTLPMPAGGTS